MRLHRVADTFLVLFIATAVPASAQAPDAPASSARTGVAVGTVMTLLPIAVGVTISAVDEEAAGIGALLITSGVVFGPMIGDAVAGLPGRAGTGFLIRVGVGTAAVVGAYALCPMDCSDSGGAAAGVLIAGGLMTLSHAIWDLATIQKAARKQELRRGSPGVSIAPFWNPATRTPGIGASIAF